VFSGGLETPEGCRTEIPRPLRGRRLSRPTGSPREAEGRGRIEGRHRQRPVGFDSQTENDGRIEQVFLKKVNDAMFHCLALMDENYIFTFGAGGPRGESKSPAQVSSLIVLVYS
jgi:hypothetical protein